MKWRPFFFLLALWAPAGAFAQADPMPENEAPESGNAALVQAARSPGPSYGGPRTRFDIPRAQGPRPVVVIHGIVAGGGDGVVRIERPVPLEARQALSKRMARPLRSIHEKTVRMLGMGALSDDELRKWNGQWVELEALSEGRGAFTVLSIRPWQPPPEP